MEISNLQNKILDLQNYIKSITHNNKGNFVSDLQRLEKLHTKLEFINVNLTQIICKVKLIEDEVKNINKSLEDWKNIYW